MNSVEALEELFAHAPAAIFRERKDAIPGDLRISWRLSVLCMLLQRFRNDRATLEHLHIVWWAMRSPDSQQLFLRWFDGDKRPDELIVRFDPSLSVTVDLAIGEDLVEVTSTGAIGLSLIGRELALEIWKDPAVLVAEKAFLSKLPRKMTQTSLKELTEWI